MGGWAMRANMVRKATLALGLAMASLCSVACAQSSSHQLTGTFGGAGSAVDIALTLATSGSHLDFWYVSRFAKAVHKTYDLRPNESEGSYSITYLGRPCETAKIERQASGLVKIHYGQNTLSVAATTASVIERMSSQTNEDAAQLASQIKVPFPHDSVDFAAVMPKCESP